MDRKCLYSRAWNSRNFALSPVFRCYVDAMAEESGLAGFDLVKIYELYSYWSMEVEHKRLAGECDAMFFDDGHSDAYCKVWMDAVDEFDEWFRKLVVKYQKQLVKYAKQVLDTNQVIKDGDFKHLRSLNAIFHYPVEFDRTSKSVKKRIAEVTAEYYHLNKNEVKAFIECANNNVSSAIHLAWMVAGGDIRMSIGDMLYTYATLIKWKKESCNFGTHVVLELFENEMLPNFETEILLWIKHIKLHGGEPRELYAAREFLKRAGNNIHLDCPDWKTMKLF